MRRRRSNPAGSVPAVASVARILAAWALVAGGFLACADGDSGEAEAARARLEAEFGRRDEAPAPDAADAPGDREAPSEGSAPAEPPAATPGATEPEDARGEEAVREDPSSSEGDAGLPATPPPSGSAVVEVDSLLALADAAYVRLERLRAAFSQRIENPLLGRTREGTGTWHQAGRNRFRMDFDDPPDDIYIADGSCLWLYEPSLHDQIMVSRLEEGVELGTIDILGRLLSEARTRYSAVDAGAEEIDGVETRVVLLTPRDLPARYVEVRLWIGISDRYVRRFRIREENETVRTVTLTRIEPQVPIDLSVFEYTPPAGVPIFPTDVRCD
ncbi:LolA family protein [Candidatus Palauibacter sp.]|uniref:LolA family protein n=1 Tax=Candidatus Palauibacter sp. TaxID=3101350 RepID=UPI003B5A832D